MKENNINCNTSNEIVDKSAPLLTSMNKRSGFMVPDGYFEQLSTEINQRRVDSIKNSRLKSIIYSFAKTKYILRYSFTIILLVIGIYFLIQINNRSANTMGIASYSADWNDTNSDFLVNEDIDEIELINLFANNSEIEFQPINTIDNNKLDSNDIINYLIDDSEDNDDYIY